MKPRTPARALAPSARKKALLVASFLLLFTLPAHAQTFHRNCGVGQLRHDDGHCQGVEQVLAQGGGTVYWVDQNHPQASDDNPGSKNLPWLTISRATARRVLKPGDAVIVRAGLYREAIRPREGGTSADKRITFAAYTGEEVVVTGADEAGDHWTVYRGSIYRRPYSQNLSADCPWRNCSSIFWRREMLIADGVVMTHVPSIEDLVPGSFFVDGHPPDRAPSWMYARFLKDEAPSNVAVEVGRRALLFAPGDDTQDCNRSALGNYRVIGFTFRHAVNRPQKGALCAGRAGSVIEENIVEWVNGLGIKCSGREHTFRGNISRDNGQAGIGGGCDASLIEYNESLRNNWKGFPWGFEAGGGKWSRVDSTTIRFHVARDNGGPGIWFDIYNNDNVIEGCRVINNYAAGIMLEHHTVRTIVRNNVVYSTRWNANDNPPWTGSGILSQAANNNTIIFNTLVANQGSGIYIRKDPGNRADDIGGDGYNDIYNNLFVHNGSATGEAVFEIHLAGKTLEAIRTNKLDGNLYLNHALTSDDNPTFGLAATAVPRYTFSTDDLGAWRSDVLGDGNAGLISAGTPTIEDAGHAEGWRLIGASLTIGAAVPMPDSIAVPAFDIEGNPRPPSGGDVGAHQYVAVSVVDEVPSAFSLEQNYPNPFNPSTMIEYSLAEGRHVALKVLNLLGQVVAVLVDEKQDAGTHQVVFENARLASGLYFYSLQAGNFTATKGMVLIK